ncbi:tryptophan 7-halogenase [Parasphingopyxis sp. CP4]|uniref:tryptophan halogenase family protein n=1 Tax=Parasphingopyxis sp. CP4 TaxID=2724527 RepID=UPI0015A35389|nr:tryptophan halogenase family protein [Parasphingopyxis sp. CP4]QLC21186.1 tryptophan 7-halogenase [Parasphingopyxis sp. CP4]
MTALGDTRIRTVVIIGGGTAGWMAAAALSQTLGRAGLSIILVESAEIGTVGVGEATLPQIRDFNRLVGIDEAEMMARTNATIKLGIEFCDWGTKGDRYIHPFGAYGAAIGPADFYHYWLRARTSGDPGSFGDYCFPIVAAQNDRFALPDENPSSQLDRYSYAFQFDASQYGAFLADFAQKRGVKRIEGKVVSVTTDGQSGFIESVSLESGEEIAGDVFVDCSGFRGLLIEQELETGYEDWSAYLPCNRAYAVPCAITDTVGPYTRATARTGGWQWRIPLQHRIGNGHVYCNRYVSDQDAVDTLMQNLEGEPLADPKQLFFLTGKRRRLWNKNCIAIGLSGGFLEPLESTSIDLIQSGILNLIALFPDRDCADSDRNEYNRLMDLEFERVRDFLMLHYVANQRDDGELWRDMREMQWPDSLRYKIDAFRTRAIVPEYESGLFQQQSWLSVFIGQNIEPESYDPRTEQMASDDLDSELSRMRTAIADRVSATSLHLDFIRDYGAAFDGERAT